MEKVALITGSGAKRIGNTVAIELAKKGYNLAIHYNKSKEESEETVKELGKLGVKAKSYQADLTKEENIRELTKKVLEDFERIDVLVNSAAAFKKIPLEKTTGEDLGFFFRVNTLSVYLMSKYVGEIMIKQKSGGSIINIADWAIKNPYLGYSSYFVSKGSIPTMTRTFANELGSRNNKVRVNCISPGPVLLPQDMPENEKERAINKTVLKKEGNPKNIALAVIHFIENDFVTGTNLAVDGGRSIFSEE